MSCGLGVSNSQCGLCNDLNNNTLAKTFCQNMQNPPIPVQTDPSGNVVNYVPDLQSCSQRSDSTCTQNSNNGMTYNCKVKFDNTKYDQFFVNCCENNAGTNASFCPTELCGTDKTTCDTYMTNMCGKTENKNNVSCGCINPTLGDQKLTDEVIKLIPASCYPSCVASGAYKRTGKDACTTDITKDTCQKIVDIMGSNASENSFITGLCGKLVDMPTGMSSSVIGIIVISIVAFIILMMFLFLLILLVRR
jgi:hypothetical protein